ncbi:uncharacterized protein IAS62_000774 [Cryptococcus decagattii]|uniref:Uncharacterized protein n=1 Tax=Cryptococcus decagattii TaxID=1859122 RepID=A0ABZ2AQM8_9TREE
MQSLPSFTNSLPSFGRARLLVNSADDVVIVSAVRTALAKAKNGVKRSKVNPARDIAVGNVLPPGGGAKLARMAQLAYLVLHLLILSIGNIANETPAGTIDIGIGAGAESMSAHYGA